MPLIGVVDDDQRIVDFVADVLKDEGYIVASYADAAGALRAFEAKPFDLVTIDIRMPQIDGIELLRRLRQTSDVPAIVITGSGDEVDELVGLRMGADDYIRKPFSPQVLIERVKAILRRPRSARVAGDQQIRKNIILCGHLRMDQDRYTCTWKEKPVGLTATEFRLLESLATRPGAIKTRNALIETACGNDVGGRTIDSHMKRLRQKFRTVDRTFNEIETVYGVGYRFPRSRE